MKCIVYRKGYKYQLKQDFTIETEIKPKQKPNSQFLDLTDEGVLTIKSGYACDGPSGPTIDTLTFMRGAFVHDALYQLMREGFVDSDKYRIKADQLLKKMCKEDGMNIFRRQWVYFGVRLFSDFATDPKKKKPEVWAPKGCP